NPTKLIKKVFPIKATSEDISVQFFPESGNMIYNIRSRVGFKAIGADGLGRKITGYVSDNNGEKVAEFSSEYAGMGSFPFTPLKGSVYTATVKFEDGSEKKVEFPKPQETGYVLTVKNSNSENITVNIFAVGAQNPNEELILVGQSHNVVKFVSKNKIDGNVLSATLPKSRFPSGITQFTVFNSSYQPLAERLVFIRHQSALSMTVKTEKENYKAREKVKMMFNAADSAGKPIQSVFSLSVINESQIPFDDVNETTIFSNLLLSSDLKGYIETPNYYFMDASPAKDKALDNLMITQGWRKFEWKNIAAETFPAITYQPEKSLSISGKIISFGGKPSVGGKVMLMSAGGTGMLLDTITDAEGRFNFDNLGFNDSTTFVVQARSSKDKKNVEILLDKVPPQLVAKNRNAANAEVNINQSMLSYLKTRKSQFDELRRNGMMRSSIMLGEVKITEAKPKVKNSTNLNGAGRADAVITADELENCGDLAICLQGRVAGLIIQNQMAYLTRSMNSSFSGPVPMQLIYDGVAMEPDFLTSIIPSDIETVEILKSGAYTSIYGMRGGGGVLIITSKTGERRTSANNFAFGITTYRPQGYYISKQFYSPVYAVSQPKTFADLRTTIYWSPNIFTAVDGKASAEFFTADKPGTYKAVIEGLDSNGSITRQVHRFNVK
ncbi:MAG: TonB-dependent receptor plug domain-containing protein, partial [Sphingobacteriaceae bacterium]